MRRVFRARWLLPIAQPPIERGWVAVEGECIATVGSPSEPVPSGPVEEVDGVVLPGLVNAHTHLELSYLHGRIPPTSRFGDWVTAVIASRRQYSDPADPAIVEPARLAIAAARRVGTALFGDVSNTLVTVPLLQESGVAAQVFYELLGFTEADPEGLVRNARTRANAVASPDVRVSLAPHAPYSVSADLFKAIRADIEAHPQAVSSVHLGETLEEVELLRSGQGEIRRVLEALGRWPPGWQPPGVGPVEYLRNLGLVDSRVLAVHGVQFDEQDLHTLGTQQMVVVSCPRSNLYVGVGSPRLTAFYDAGVSVAFGTDSLASVDDLNMFAELAEARRVAPTVPARRLLESATLVGAKALGFGEDFGSLVAGKRAAMLAVSLPARVADVEEYLVGGVDPTAVTWLST